MTVDLSQFHETFFDESFEGIEIMESGLLNIDISSPDSEKINDIFRAAHSIKGGSGTFGFQNIADFTHVMETLLDEMRDERREVTKEIVDILLKSIDILRMMMHSTRDKKTIDNNDVSTQLKVLEDLLNRRANGVTSKNEKKTEIKEHESKDWKIEFKPYPGLMQSGNDPVRIIRELSLLGDCHVETIEDSVPCFDDLNPENCYLKWSISLKGDISSDEIKEIFLWVEDECDLSIDVIETNQKKPGKSKLVDEEKFDNVDKNTDETVSDKASEDNVVANSIRVNIDKIDELINMVGELVITQSMLSLLGGDFSIDNVEKMNLGLEQLERHTRDLQESVMMIRMLPISFSFNRFPRQVRDLSDKLGKKIDLKISGESTEIDKTLIEKLSDPLIHLVRNSVDHGIEMPEERLANGKSETGTIRLNAFHKSGSVYIEVSDDGKGINKDKVLEKAIEKGLVVSDVELKDHQIYELLFEPGVTTANNVSDLSGRGVGMDVVRRNILSLGGTIDVRTSMGEGSTFSIRLPLTLAILDGQTVKIGDEIYIIPLTSIVESIKCESEMISKVAGRTETFKLREEYISLIRLSSLFGINDSAEDSPYEGLVVVVESENKKCGLYVDELLGQNQVVIKSLEDNYKKVDGLSGATIMGDGSVAMILDVPGILRMSSKH